MPYSQLVVLNPIRRSIVYGCLYSPNSWYSPLGFGVCVLLSWLTDKMPYVFFIICRRCVPPLLRSFLFLTFCGSSRIYWGLSLACRVVELPIDIFVLWLWVAPADCSSLLHLTFRCRNFLLKFSTPCI